MKEILLALAITATLGGMAHAKDNASKLASYDTCMEDAERHAPQDSTPYMRAAHKRCSKLAKIPLENFWQATAKRAHRLDEQHR